MVLQRVGHAWVTELNWIIRESLQFSVFFFMISFFDFPVRVMLSPWNKFRMVPSSAILWNSLSRIDANSEVLGEIHLWSHECLFWGCFEIADSISLLIIILFTFCISSWFSLGRLYIFKNFPMSSKLYILLVYSCSE